jgi:hypothetical protein
MHACQPASPPPPPGVPPIPNHNNHDIRIKHKNLARDTKKTSISHATRIHHAMSLERYFADLISVSGALELVLESDNASTNSPPPCTKKMLRKNAGPPNFPLRQVSRDDLRSLPTTHHKRTLRRPQQQQQQQQDTDTLKEFYNEVAPVGLRPRPNKKCFSPPHHANPLLAPGVMLSHVLHLTDTGTLSPLHSMDDEPSKSIWDFIDEVQEIVVGNTKSKDCGNDRRWSGSHIIIPPVVSSDVSDNKDRRWSGSHVATNAAT